MPNGNRVVPCGRTDSQTNMTKLNVPFRNFANALKSETLFYVRIQCVPLGKHFKLRLQNTSLFMLFKKKVTLCSEVHTEDIKAR